jgi:hypothetical protein
MVLGVLLGLKGLRLEGLRLGGLDEEGDVRHFGDDLVEPGAVGIVGDAGVVGLVVNNNGGVVRWIWW